MNYNKMTKAQLIEEIEKLKNENELLLKKINSEKIHNERGAGRKEKLSEEQKKEVRKCYRITRSMAFVSRKFNISVGLVHKIIHEKDIEEKKQ